jgi:hypothetical protein
MYLLRSSPLDLPIERRNVGRQQAVQIERVPLGVGEGGALVKERIVQQFVAVQSGFDNSRVLGAHGGKRGRP